MGSVTIAKQRFELRRDEVERALRAETLRPFGGQWVAVRDGELLVGAPTAQAVVGWLASHGLRADSMFRVPADERALGGMAPL